MSKGLEMTAMTRWDAFHDLRAAQDQMNYLNRMFIQARGREGHQSGAEFAGTPTWAPAVDIFERKDAYVVTAELPGVKVDDLDIAFQDGLLTIQGERRLVADSSDERTHLVERRYGLFRRSITLPQHVIADAIDASSEDGVLRVVVPKAEEAKPRRIEVHAVQTHRAGQAQTPAPANAPRNATS
jgi:HSP20 family protein